VHQEYENAEVSEYENNAIIQSIKDKELKKRVLSIIDKIFSRKEELWGYIKYLQMVDHGEIHTRNVVNLLTRFLVFSQSKLLNELTDMEKFCLIFAVWFHDVGGRGLPEEDKKFLDFLYTRGEHPWVGEEIFIEKAPSFGFSKEERRIIAEIIPAHSSREDIDKLPKEVSVNNQKVRPRLLASILSFMDACDTQQRRVGGEEGVEDALKEIEIREKEVEKNLEKTKEELEEKKKQYEMLKLKHKKKEISKLEDKIKELEKDKNLYEAYINFYKEAPKHFYKHLSVKEVYFTQESVILEPNYYIRIIYPEGKSFMEYFNLALEDIRKEYERVKKYFNEYEITIREIRTYDEKRDNKKELEKQLSKRIKFKVGEKFRGHLEKLKKDFEEKKPIDGKSLSSYYVESSFKLTKGETWNKKDEEVEGEEWKIEDFLKDDKRWRVVIGASFGLGKTSFVQYLANKLANLCLSNESECSYFPIVVKLSEVEDIKNYFVYNQENLDHFIQNIIENESRNVLLILDGLDEYKSEIKDLFNYITELHNKYEKVKVIVTSRLVDVPRDYIEEYVRLMPLIEGEVNEFFKKYGVKLNYKKCEELGLSRAEITKPLFCWILGMISLDHPYELTLNPKWSSGMKRSLLYYVFIHSLIKGKHKKEMDKFKEYYYVEKELLRYTAAIKNLYKELDEEKLKSKLAKMYKKETEHLEEYLEPLITSYFYRSSQEIVSKKIEFIHKSFEEYLLAEYYYESIRDGKMYRLNAGEPSIETMEFLKGLIDILKNKEAKEFLRKIDENPLIKDEDRQKIIENSRRIAESESIIIKADEEEKEEEIWKEACISSDDYAKLWWHRWIALSVFAWLHENETIDKQKIVSLINLSSHLMPWYVKNLERINLRGANLKRANLGRADIREAILERADLSEANLGEANLERANLERADLSGANLIGALR